MYKFYVKHLNFDFLYTHHYYILTNFYSVYILINKLMLFTDHLSGVYFKLKQILETLKSALN